MAGLILGVIHVGQDTDDSLSNVITPSGFG